MREWILAELIPHIETRIANNDKIKAQDRRPAVAALCQAKSIELENIKNFIEAKIYG